MESTHVDNHTVLTAIAKQIIYSLINNLDTNSFANGAQFFFNNGYY